MLFRTLLPLFLLSFVFLEVSLALDEHVERTLSDIDGILAQQDQLTEEAFQEKIGAEIQKLSKALDDIELTPEEVKKLFEPIKDWSHDLGERVENFKSNNNEITPENLVHVIEESIENHPQLLKEAAIVLKDKDSSKVEKFIAKIKSVRKKFSKKIKSGWKKVKHFVKTKPLHFLSRSRHVGQGLFGLILYPIFGAITFAFRDRFSTSMMMSAASGSAGRIFNALFKFHGDSDFSAKIDQQYNEKQRNTYYNGGK